WVQRKGQNLLRSRFRMRECSKSVTEITIRRLQMYRNRIVDPRLNSLSRQHGLQAIPIFGSQGVNVVDVARPRHLLRRFYFAICQQFVVLANDRTARLGPRLQVTELYS